MLRHPVLQRCIRARASLIVMWLAILPSCDRNAATDEAATSAGTAGDPWANRAPQGSGPPIPDLMEVSRGLQKQLDGINERHRKQVDKLEQQISEIQQLLAAGKYDEAELHLVDIHWRPESSEHDNAALTRLYDEKRAALTAFLQRKRPVPAAAPAAPQ